MTTWRKSSHSGTTQGSDCIEIADFSNALGIRDSKNPHGGYLTMSREELAHLINRAKAGALDLE